MKYLGVPLLVVFFSCFLAGVIRGRKEKLSDAQVCKAIAPHMGFSLKSKAVVLGGTLYSTKLSQEIKDKVEEISGDDAKKATTDFVPLTVIFPENEEEDVGFADDAFFKPTESKGSADKESFKRKEPERFTDRDSHIPFVREDELALERKEFLERGSLSLAPDSEYKKKVLLLKRSATYPPFPSKFIHEGLPPAAAIGYKAKYVRSYPSKYKQKHLATAISSAVSGYSLGYLVGFHCTNAEYSAKAIEFIKDDKQTQKIMNAKFESYVRDSETLVPLIDNNGPRLDKLKSDLSGLTDVLLLNDDFSESQYLSAQTVFESTLSMLPKDLDVEAVLANANRDSFTLLWWLVFLPPIFAVLMFWNRSAKESESENADEKKDKKNKQGFNEISNCQDPKAWGDVVFVHGLDGDPITTWHPEGKPKEFWPKRLGNKSPNIAVWSLGYGASSSKWIGPSMPLYDRANNILDLIGSTPNLGERPIVFVCHSLGGLLVKQILRNASESNEKVKKLVAKNTKAVVFLATPHSGAGLADWLCRLGKTLAGVTVTVEELKANNPTLRALNEWYRNKVGRMKIKTIVYGENEKTKGVMVVDKGSVDPGIPDVTPTFVDRNHINICKPEKGEQVDMRVQIVVDENITKPE